MQKPDFPFLEPRKKKPLPCYIADLAYIERKEKEKQKILKESVQILPKESLVQSLSVQPLP